MNQDQLKQMVGEAARDEVLKLPAGQVLGVVLAGGPAVVKFPRAVGEEDAEGASIGIGGRGRIARLFPHQFQKVICS